MKEAIQKALRGKPSVQTSSRKIARCRAHVLQREKKKWILD